MTDLQSIEFEFWIALLRRVPLLLTIARLLGIGDPFVLRVLITQVTILLRKHESLSELV